MNTFERMNTAQVVDEIERKWVMRNLPFIKWDDKIYIDQFYLMYEGKPHRIRFSYENDIWIRTTSGRQERKLRSTEFIHKEKVGKGENKEHHIAVTYEEAMELSRLATRRCTKVRHVHHDDVKYEVDVFLNTTLVMMEAEVEIITQELFIPERIQSEILAEVTGIAGFDNFNLSHTI